MKSQLFVLSVLSASLALSDVVATADFTQSPGKLRPTLHSTSWATRIKPRGPTNDDEAIRSLKQYAFRTHDAPLCNVGQHVVDTHEIFPLMHLDANDPWNYVFKPTDHYLEVNFALGLKCLYRLGSSIEHTGPSWGYNTVNPKDHAKYAEVLAGIVRHYTRGWGDGYEWGERFTGWELFNEPNVANCWRGTKDEFLDLFVTCLKRLKREFPDLRIGGPAFGWVDEPYMRELLRACKAAGVAPDFLSWHSYSDSPYQVLELPAKARKICDEEGFPECGLVLNEWHYLLKGDFKSLKQPQDGPSGMKNIDSAVFTLQVETGFHDTPLDESYYYGCGYDGDYGYKEKDGRYAKVYYPVRAVGEMMATCEDRAVCTTADRRCGVFGAWTKDRRGAQLFVSDFRGPEMTLAVGIKGLEAMTNATVSVLDGWHDFAPAKGFTWKDGMLTLEKYEPGSAAFHVVFTPPDGAVL